MRKTYVYIPVAEALLIGPSLEQCVLLKVSKAVVDGVSTFDIGFRLPEGWRYCFDNGMPKVGAQLSIVRKAEPSSKSCDPELGLGIRFYPPNEMVPIDEVLVDEKALVKTRCEILAEAQTREGKVKFTVTCPEDWKVKNNSSSDGNDLLSQAPKSATPAEVTVPQQ